MKLKMKEKILLFKVRTKKDSAAFGELYDLHVERIYRFVYFKVSNKEESEDITSEVFLKTWNYLIENKDKEVKSFTGLVYRIARNLIIDFYRQRAKKSECSIDSVVLMANNDDFKKIEINQDVERLMIVVKKMKQEYQEVVLLKYIEELSTAEIAKILDKTKTSVRVTLHRATKKLQEMLGE
ncbi:MAG: RNA polymerase sigma factor [Candidatus Magasanikbacteria bacterium]